MLRFYTLCSSSEYIHAYTFVIGSMYACLLFTLTPCVFKALYIPIFAHQHKSCMYKILLKMSWECTIYYVE